MDRSGHEWGVAWACNDSYDLHWKSLTFNCNQPTILHPPSIRYGYIMDVHMFVFLNPSGCCDPSSRHPGHRGADGCGQELPLSASGGAGGDHGGLIES